MSEYNIATTPTITQTTASASVKKDDTNTSVFNNTGSENSGILRTEQEVNVAVKKLADTYNIPQDKILKIIKDIAGFNVKDLQNLEETEFKRVFESLDYALKVCPEKIGNKNKNYEKRLQKTYEWFKENGREFGFLDLLKRMGTVDKNVQSLDDVSDEQIKTTMIKILSSKKFETKIADFKNLSPAEQKEAIKQQLAGFNLLLSKESDENKSRIFKIFCEVAEGDSIASEGFLVLKNSFKTKESLKTFLNKFTPSELAFLGVNEEDIKYITAMQSSELNDEESKALLERIKTTAENFKNDPNNKAILESIKEKQRIAKETGEAPVFTEEETKIISLLKKVGEAALDGFIVGINSRKEGDNEALTTDALQYAKENDIYDAVLEGTYKLSKDLAEKHPEYIKNLDIEKLNENLNKYTNGDYEKAINLVKEQNAATAAETSAASQNEPANYIGFAQRTAVNPVQDNNKIREIKETLGGSEEHKSGLPTVSKKQPENLSIRGAIAQGAGYYTLRENFSLSDIIHNFRNLTSTSQELFAKEVEKINNLKQKMSLASLNNLLFTKVFSDGLTEEERLLAVHNGVSGIVADSVGVKEEDPNKTECA